MKVVGSLDSCNDCSAPYLKRGDISGLCQPCLVKARLAYTNKVNPPTPKPAPTGMKLRGLWKRTINFIRGV